MTLVNYHINKITENVMASLLHKSRGTSASAISDGAAPKSLIALLRFVTAWCSPAHQGSGLGM